MFKFYHYYLYLLLQFGTFQKCSNITLPSSERRQYQVMPVQNRAFCLEHSTGARTMSWPGGHAHLALLWPLSWTLREPAVLLQPGPCGSSESFPRGQSHLSQSCEFHCAAPDRRSVQQVMHVRAPAQVEWPSPSQTTSAATTPLHLTGAGRSVDGDQPPGQHALTETRVSSLTEHRANFWVNQEWWVAPTQLSTPLQPHPQGYEMQLSQRKAPGYLTCLTASVLNTVFSTKRMASLCWDFTVL